MLNRAERRAIEHGRGRNVPFVEVVDVESMHLYMFSMTHCHPETGRGFDNKTMFIEHQIDPFDWDDDVLDQY